MEEELGFTQTQGEADPGELATILRRAWVSEKSAPEVLDYEEEAVEQLLALINDQEEASREQATDTIVHQFIYNVYQMEIGRLKFLLAAYLRTRLYKIEQFVMHIMKTETLRGRLSPKELQYARDYRKLITNHMQESCLNQLPEKFRKVDQVSATENMVPAPNENAYVFCDVREPIGAININDNMDTIELEKGDIYILRYRVVAPLLRAGQVSLM